MRLDVTFHFVDFSSCPSEIREKLAEFGYSMKIDEIKTIEDALNEATKVLKKQKEVNENKD